MALNTLDRTPPPFFRQGPSALTKLVVCAALAVFLMVADARFALARQLRAALATLLYYPQQVLLVPVVVWDTASDYFLGVHRATTREEQARRELTLQAERALRIGDLEAENARLRALLDLRPRLGTKAQTAQILYEASDPYSRKVVIDRGVRDAVVAGSPVINEAGVLGQVTRVYPLSSEVTLLVDKDAAIPVLNTRTQARGAAFGSAAAAGRGMEMRFMAGNADVQVGDLLTTSGLDGIYPPGLPVAKVTAVDRKLESGFARIALAPTASPDGVRHVMVLEPLQAQLPPRPEPLPDEAKPAASAVKKGSRR